MRRISTMLPSILIALRCAGVSPAVHPASPFAFHGVVVGNFTNDPSINYRVMFACKFVARVPPNRVTSYPQEAASQFGTLAHLKR